MSYIGIIYLYLLYYIVINVIFYYNDKADSDHTHTFASLTSKPTTLSGYGITDASPKAGSSSLTTCSKGTFGTAATYGVTTSATSGSSNLITSGGVYSVIATGSTITLNSTYKCYYTKTGNVVTVYALYNGATTSSGITAGTLPSGYRPKQNAYGCSFNHAAYLQVTTDGVVKLGGYGDNGWCYATVCYGV